MTTTPTPLGYINLPNGAKAIYPMNDIFLNYTFQSSQHWEALRLAVNLLIDAYILHNPTTCIKPIKGNIIVKTQFKYLLDTDGKTTRDQDIKMIEEAGNSTYIEFQNKANTRPPIETRSIEYFGLGISHSKGKLANQMWLLAEDLDTVLHGKTFARYILKDEVSGSTHPATSGILYISLTKLSQETTPAGELAAFLLGKDMNSKDEMVCKIINEFDNSFSGFKEDKEAVKVLSLAERYGYEGEVRGEARGRTEALIESAVKFLNKGFDPQLVSDTLQLSDEQLEKAKKYLL